MQCLNCGRLTLKPWLIFCSDCWEMGGPDGTEIENPPWKQYAHEPWYKEYRNSLERERYRDQNHPSLSLDGLLEAGDMVYDHIVPHQTSSSRRRARVAPRRNRSKD